MSSSRTGFCIIGIFVVLLFLLVPMLTTTPRVQAYNRGQPGKPTAPAAPFHQTTDASLHTKAVPSVHGRILDRYAGIPIEDCYPDMAHTPDYKFPPLTPRMATQNELWTATVNESLASLNLTNWVHRKYWEYGFVLQAATAAGLLKAGNEALCFAAGTEPLPSYFASLGMRVLATDLVEGEDSGWRQGNQQAHQLSDLFKPNLTSQEQFEAQVRFQSADMNFPPSDTLGKFDLVWTLCSVEHVGSIRLGQRFILNSLQYLKPGGMAVHSMEFNLGSIGQTVAEGHSSLWRQQDVQEVIDDARRLGFQIKDPCWAAGSGPADTDAGVLEQTTTQFDNHLKLRIDGYPCTSMGLIFIRPADSEVGDS